MEIDNKIIIIDDDELFLKSLSILLKTNFEIYTATTGKEGLEKIKEHRPQLVILDYKLPDISGLDLISKIKKLESEIPIVFITGYGDIDLAVSAIKEGAIDFFTKPFEYRQFLSYITELSTQKNKITDIDNTRHGIIGNSDEMNQLWVLLQKFAPPDVNILLEGETGTGKELFARAIHKMSKFNNGPFMPIDCASLPESILESEIFGYEKGAFTGAYESKPGKFELTQNGSIFFLKFPMFHLISWIFSYHIFHYIDLKNDHINHQYHVFYFLKAG